MVKYMRDKVQEDVRVQSEVEFCPLRIQSQMTAVTWDVDELEFDTWQMKSLDGCQMTSL